MKVYKAELDGMYAGGMIIVAHETEEEAYALAEDSIQYEELTIYSFGELEGVVSENVGVLAEQQWID